MSLPQRDNYLTYKSPQGVEIVPYGGYIINVEADAIVTRDDDVMKVPSGVTKALIDEYPDFQERRETLEKKTNVLFFTKRLKLWSIYTSKLPNSSKSVNFVFHAIMNLDDDCRDAKLEENMEKMFLNLLRKSEKYKVKVLAVPLFGTGGGDASPVVKVAVKCISDHKPTHLQKVVLVSTIQTDIYKIIYCCQSDLTLIHGNQPDGRMDVTTNASHLPGFGNFDTIVITYRFSGGTQGEEHPNPGKPFKGITRLAYLPDSPDGREVLALLRTAFDRKLTFTIGRSAKAGQPDVVKWNCIAHKTSKEGDKHGFPDPHYLTKLRDDLAKRGITKGRYVPVSNSLAVTTPKAKTKGPYKGLDTKPEAGHAQEVKTDLETLEKELNKRNLVVRDNGAKGNCMFVSLSQQIEHVLKKNIEHRDLREKLVKYLRENPTVSQTQLKDFLVNESWEEYLDRMGRLGQWGDHIMLIAAANVYQVEIVVVRSTYEERPIEPSTRHGSLPRLVLGFVSGNHYVSLEKYGNSDILIPSTYAE